MLGPPIASIDFLNISSALRDWFAEAGDARLRNKMHKQAESDSMVWGISYVFIVTLSFCHLETDIRL